MNKPRHLILNAFEMACPGHICHGLWTHPRDQSHRFGELDYWVTLARTLEGGLFDGVFFADGLGAFDVYQGSYDTVLAEAVQLPRLDPMLLVPSMAHATQHLGFGITSNVLYEPPALFARRMSTLDQLTGGRVGWNVVTATWTARQGPTATVRNRVMTSATNGPMTTWTSSTNCGSEAGRPMRSRWIANVAYTPIQAVWSASSIRGLTMIFARPI